MAAGSSPSSRRWAWAHASLGGVSRDHVQPDAEAQLTPDRLGPLADRVELLCDRGRRLAPRQVDVSVARGHVQRLRRRAAQVDLGPDGSGDDLGPAHVDVLAAKVDRLTGPELTQNL